MDWSLESLSLLAFLVALAAMYLLLGLRLTAAIQR